MQQTFADYAPTLDGVGVTKEDCDKIEIKEKSTSGEEPSLTKTKTLNAIKEFADIEKANGHLAIARKVGLTKSQVAKLHKEFLLSKKEDEEDEEVITK